jgi:putative transposase
MIAALCARHASCPARRHDRAPGTPARHDVPHHPVTRRCSQRQFLLKPSETTNAVFRFVLAVAAERHGIKVHAYCVLSNLPTGAGSEAPGQGEEYDGTV